jgi:hypothetical protein
MQVTVTVSDELIRDAAQRGRNVVEHVEALIDAGRKLQEKPSMTTAIDRIRALRVGSDALGS